MWALTYWAEAVTKRGGRVLLSVQLFDSLELGYKRMLSQQLHQMQTLMAASVCVMVAAPTQQQPAVSPERMYFRLRVTLAGRPAKLAS